MAKKTKRIEYAEAFDRLMEEQFGEGFDTEWSLLQGSFGGYVTRRKNGRPLTKQMALFGRGVSRGIAAAEDHYHAD